MRKPTPLDDYLFDIHGYVIIKNALEPELLDELNREFDNFPRDLEPGGWYRGAQRRDYSVATGLEFHHCLEMGEPFEKLIDHPSWIEYVHRYCGESDSYVDGLFIDECITSIRTSGGYHPIHSGGYQGALRGAYNYNNGAFRCGQCNVIMALTDVGPGDGPTIVIPGSHKANLPFPEMDDYSYGGKKEGELPPGAVEVHLEKGDAVLFVDGITHGGINRTNEGERRVIIFRYGPSWGQTRYGYQYSQELLDRLTTARRHILQPIKPWPHGTPTRPEEGIVVRKREHDAASD